MQARVLDQGSFSDMFDVTNGVRQGCVLAPTLFSIMFAAMLKDAFRDDQLAAVFEREWTAEYLTSDAFKPRQRS